MNTVLLRSYRHRPIFNRLAIRSLHLTPINLGPIKPFLLADIGEGITECEVIQWFVKPGATVAEFDKICEVQSDKASVEISSRYAGKIVKVHYNQNEIAKVGAPLVDIEVDDDSSEEATLTESSSDKSSHDLSKRSPYASTWETPSVRRLLHEYGLNITQVNGSGKHGRVLKGDVLSHIKRASLIKREMKQSVELPLTEIKKEQEKSVPLTPIQKAMFRTMTESLSIPQLGYKDEIELNAMSEYRDSLNKYIASQRDAFPFKKISYLPIFIKSLSVSLHHYPIMNAQLRQQDMSIRYRDYHNIGVAMDTPQGLIVPNVKNVEKKTILDIASEIHRLTQLAQKGALSPSDLQGGTITISNIGTIGGTYANPVIVSSEIAIVALGSARKLPRFDPVTHKLVPKFLMPVSWSADHRVIDGATIASFSNMWKSLIESPALLSSKLQ